MDEVRWKGRGLFDYVDRDLNRRTYTFYISFGTCMRWEMILMISTLDYLR